MQVDVDEKSNKLRMYVSLPYRADVTNHGPARGNEGFPRILMSVRGCQPWVWTGPLRRKQLILFLLGIPIVIDAQCDLPNRQ